MHPRRLLAFAAVWFIWGSTYLAIRFAIETLPPWMMAAMRFLSAGAMLYAWCRWRGAPRPTAAEWRTAAIIGLLLPAAGNGTVVWSEGHAPSGIVALLVATVPLWLLVLRWRAGGSPPRPVDWAGVGLGLIGVALLVSHGGGTGGVSPVVLLVMLGGTFSWAYGSLWSRSLPQPRAPLLAAAMEMLAGGAALVIAALLTGEGAQLAAAHVSLRSLVSLAYLSIFGSMLAFSAYKYLLAEVPPAHVGTYAFVNPVVAVLLGWAFAGEGLGGRTVAAMAVIVGAVVLITFAPGAGAPAADPVAE
jgi:drug/metabolite transporter (DMT)-like permease